MRLLCYEKCYNKMTRVTKEDGENTDRIIAKGQIQVGRRTGKVLL